MKALKERLELAQAVAKKAGSIALHRFHHLDTLEVQAKGRQDYVSAADREVEVFIRDALQDAFPHDGFLGEETGGAIQEPMWVVDPIDGTGNFVRGIPMFAVSIAWVHEARCQVGVLYEPTTDRLFSAYEGGPATLNENLIQVRACNRLDEAVIAFGYSERSGREKFLGRLTKILEAHAEFRRFGAATVQLAAVACGQVDAFIQNHLAPWDVLAGLLIVERAGGMVGDFLCNNGIKNGNPCFAASPGIAKELASLIELEAVIKNT